jgi:hypoxanthine-DNA glycosylase
MTDSDPVHEAFDRIADASTRLLVLGSLPGVQSLAERRYYANRRNHFWRLMTPVVGVDLVALDYPDRLAALLRAGVGLWDVIGSARRTGSLDSDIRDTDARDLKSAIATLPSLRALAFNGGKAFAVGARQRGNQPGVDLLRLPSSSGAHAVGLAVKQPAWDTLRAYLQ